MCYQLFRNYNSSRDTIYTNKYTNISSCQILKDASYAARDSCPAWEPLRH